MIPQPTLEEQQAYVATLAPVRLRRFRTAVGGAERAAVELYLLDAAIASHMHAVVRFVEVLLRESIHRALTDAYGERWFVDRADLLDEDALEAVANAVETVGERAPAGKVVAQLMFGTWSSLLGKGAKKPDGTKAAYASNLWEPAVSSAFDGDRSDAHRKAMSLNWARNRINHCEPVVFGFPQPGLGDGTVQIRHAPARVLRDAGDLTAMMQPALASWLGRWDELEALLAHRLAASALELVEDDEQVQLHR